MKTPSAPAYPKIIEELRANPLERFSTIAARVGVSREYVRQVAARLGETAKDRIAARKAIRLPRLPSLRFYRAVRKWLREIGYDYCSCGRHVAPVADIYIRPNICRECNSRRVNEYLHRTGMAKTYYPATRRKYAVSEGAGGAGYPTDSTRCVECPRRGGAA